MDKRIKLNQTEMCNYYIREQKVFEYGNEFFKDLCGCLVSTETCFFVNDNVIPLSCYNIMEACIYAVENKTDNVVQGGFVSACKKQAYIRIGIDTQNSILNKKLKQTIRHEIIHYYLWLVDLPHEDDSLEFWCLCYAFDGGAYEALSDENKEYYELFKELYDTKVKDLPWNVSHILIGQMITFLGKTSKDKYVGVITDLVDNIKKMYSMV